MQERISLNKGALKFHLGETPDQSLFVQVPHLNTTIVLDADKAMELLEWFYQARGYLYRLSHSMPPSDALRERDRVTVKLRNPVRSGETGTLVCIIDGDFMVRFDDGFSCGYDGDELLFFDRPVAVRTESESRDTAGGDEGWIEFLANGEM
jgi:hypothetical protein